MEWLPENFHFIRPWWLTALIPVIILLIYAWSKRLTSKSWETFCDKELLPHMLISRQADKRKHGILLLFLASILIILSLAGPTWERLPQPVFKKDSALVILLDLSLSMEATDIKPSRLERARFKINDLLDQREEGQTALMVYAGSAFTVTPLTDDVKTIRSQLSALEPEIMPVPGSNTTGALQNAVGLLSQAGMSTGHILLITDEVVEKHKDVFSYIAEQGYNVSVLGVGTTEGAPIPVAQGGFLKGPQGEIVVPKLNRLALREMAALGNGYYHDLVNNNDDIDYLSNFFVSEDVLDNESIRDIKADVWKEQGPWLLLLLLPLASLSFRKGILVIVLLPNLILVDEVSALDWNALWINKDQQAKQYIENQEYDKAAELFNDPAWKAAAQYNAKDFSAAENILQESDGENGLYNLGNALARQGKYKDAISAYERALEINPNNEDAAYNKSIIEDELKKQEQSQQEEGEKDSSETSDKKQKNSEPKESEDESAQSQGQQQQAQNSEQQDKDQKNGEDEQQGSEQQKDERSKTEEEKELAEQKEAEEKEKNKEDSEESLQEQSTLTEVDQATEQWLRRIPDDPGGLLKRKFKYQYQRQQKRVPEGEQYW